MEGGGGGGGGGVYSDSGAQSSCTKKHNCYVMLHNGLFVHMLFDHKVVQDEMINKASQYMAIAQASFNLTAWAKDQCATPLSI